MPESFKTTRYEDRPSSKIGFAEYLSQHVVWVFAPVLGFAAGLGLRKATKIPMLEEVSEGLQGWIRSKASRDAMRHAANATKSYIPRKGEMWGLLLGGAYGTFRLWRANTKQQLEVDQITKNVEALRDLESADQYLTRENEQLRQQLKFSERHISSQSQSHTSRVDASRESVSETQR